MMYIVFIIDHIYCLINESKMLILEGVYCNQCIWSNNL